MLRSQGGQGAGLSRAVHVRELYRGRNPPPLTLRVDSLSTAFVKRRGEGQGDGGGTTSTRRRHPLHFQVDSVAFMGDPIDCVYYERPTRF